MLMGGLCGWILAGSNLTAQDLPPKLAGRLTYGCVESGPAQFVPSDAQTVDPRPDRPFVFWIGGGFGYGSAERICSVCDESRHPGGSSFQGRLGFALNRRLLLGLEAAVWINGWGIWSPKEVSIGRKIYRNHFLLVSYLYPLRHTRLFAKLGAGFSSFTAYDRYLPYGDSIPSEIHGDGPGLAAGVGYDFKITRQLFISPSMTYYYGILGDLTLNDRIKIASNRRLKLIDFNLAVTFHAPK